MRVGDEAMRRLWLVVVGVDGVLVPVPEPVLDSEVLTAGVRVDSPRPVTVLVASRACNDTSGLILHLLLSDPRLDTGQHSELEEVPPVVMECPEKEFERFGLHIRRETLSDDGIHLLHAQGDDAGEKGLEHLAWLLDHHSQDLQELLHHPASGAALLERGPGRATDSRSDCDGFLDEQELEALFTKELEKVYYPKNEEDDMVEMEEERLRMREHVMNEVDTNKDRLVTLEEFLKATEKEEFLEPDSWETLDHQQFFTEEELKEYENIIALQENELKKKADELQEQKEELQRQHDQLEAQKLEYHQVIQQMEQK
ncbi:hypothetical protein P7K49_027274 [Saguinus oedipus]|uniref:EF-hand domain-containing protein n=1 Tax=Saguinus oedipus TaxID=9490 RepID=A0ABQ9U903_SAGOE|nr:hypothetical protein P7K49_027274 [Saguinus oedipus]